MSLDWAKLNFLKLNLDYTQMKSDIFKYNKEIFKFKQGPILFLADKQNARNKKRRLLTLRLVINL